jgi:hypothetical protein
VALLCPDPALPESWLPPEVELRFTSDLVQEAASLRGWTEVLFASGTGEFYDGLQLAIRDLTGRLESGWAQILFRELAMPCGVGLCYACAFKTRGGVALNCQLGPVLDLADWVVGE